MTFRFLRNEIAEEDVNVNETLAEFWTDWKLAGKAPRTAMEYGRVLRPLLEDGVAGVAGVAGVPANLSLPTVKAWVSEGRTKPLQRDRARAARAFFRWAAAEEVLECEWWKRIPTVRLDEAAQETVTEADFELVLAEVQDDSGSSACERPLDERHAAE